ncbi:MAG: zinc-ribbon domain-containing protein [Pseudolysinimonas sp.]
MTCHYCGTALPDGALFCGECGQPVATTLSSDASTGSPAAGFSIADLAFSSPGETSEPEDDDWDLPDGSPLDGAVAAGQPAHCPQCGEPMAEGDVFCGECGFVLRTVSPPTGESAVVEPRFDARDSDATTEVEPVIADEPVGADEQVSADEPVEIDRLVLEPAPAFAAPAPVDDEDLEFDEPLPFSEAEATPLAKVSPRSRPIPDPFPWGAEQPLREDLEATRLVADPALGTRYVLQFSTGESVTVAGSGLVGRNPSMQPGEYVDQLVPIFDAGKSVSKTHLEFGQEAGRFWVSDRYSTNGSVIRQPDSEPRRCDAGRRYFIARGTRVDVGEQFFVVS